MGIIDFISLKIGISIKRKIFLIFIFIIFLFLTFNIWTIYFTSKIINEEDEMVNNLVMINNVIVTTRNQLENEMREICYGRKEFDHGKQYELLKAINTNLNKVELLIKSENSQTKVVIAKRVFITIKEDVAEIRDVIKEKKSFDVISEKFNDFMISTESFNENLEKVIFFELQESEKLSIEINKEFKRLIVIIIVLIIGILSISIISEVLVSNNIVTPIKKLCEITGIVATGNLDVEEIKVSTNDEIKVLANSFNIMIKSMKDRNKRLMETNIELVETQNQLIESEKMVLLGKLVAGVAHEINTPIGVCILSNSHLNKRVDEIHNQIANNQIKKSEFIKNLEEIKKTNEILEMNLKRAADLIISFKQVAVDQTFDDYREVEVYDYIEKIILSLSPEIKKRKIKIDIIGDDQIRFKLHPGSFSQIITNLILNSFLHAYAEGESGNITIQFNLNKDKFELKYKDDGCGISKENIEKIFEPFYTTKKNNGGTGLGLSILKNIIVMKYKGTIKCTSTIGEGSLFEIVLPIDKSKLSVVDDEISFSNDKKM